ncbi:hypothetical protein AB0P32_29410 [Streptomyces sp. NPDC085995]|uniref:hypothetical protein n=1 Tax=Streptomyces sp. NPDC085995 TaxID=3154861 RepID=UPI003442E2F6
MALGEDGPVELRWRELQYGCVGEELEHLGGAPGVFQFLADHGTEALGVPDDEQQPHRRRAVRTRTELLEQRDDVRAHQRVQGAVDVGAQVGLVHHDQRGPAPVAQRAEQLPGAAAQQPPGGPRIAECSREFQGQP